MSAGGTDARDRFDDEGYVSFFRAGDAVDGEFQCSECGYGVTIHGELPQCPMCGRSTWEPVPARRVEL